MDLNGNAIKMSGQYPCYIFQVRPNVVVGSGVRCSPYRSGGLPKSPQYSPDLDLAAALAKYETRWPNQFSGFNPWF